MRKHAMFFSCLASTLVAQSPVDYAALQREVQAALKTLNADYQAQRSAGKAQAI